MIQRIEVDILRCHDHVNSAKENPTRLAELLTDEIFCPVLPLMEKGSVLGDSSVFLQEHARSLDQELQKMARQYPASTLQKLVTSEAASFCILARHLQQLCSASMSAVDYVEDMLKNQLIQAIGKEVDSKQFDEFMSFHQKKIFLPQYAPRPFCYAIRQPECYPDGELYCVMNTWDEKIASLAAPQENLPAIGLPPWVMQDE